MSARKLIVFKHELPMGNAPAHVLFDKVTVKRVDPKAEAPARHFSDYQVNVDRDSLPDGVTVFEPF